MIDSLQPGGAERSLATLAPGLIARGISLNVAFLHNRDGVADQLAACGAGLHSLAGSPSRRRWLAQSRSLIQRLEPDLVHTSLFEADQVGRLAATMGRVPVVSSLVGVRYGPEQRENPQFRRSRLRAAQAADIASARMVRRFHAVSEHVAHTMSRRLGVRRARIDVIARARSEASLGRRSPHRRERVRRNFDLRGSVVLAVARNEHVKGLDRLIAAMANLRECDADILLLVAGSEGSATPALREQVAVASLHDQVRFLGVRDDVADLMCGADLLVLPSRSEGFPGVLVEAMMLELPIIASDIPAVHEVLGPDPASLVINCADANALGAAITRLIRYPPDVTALRDRAVERFGLDAVADQMVDFYERALG